MSFGKLALRLTLGSLFFGHGAQKLFGWFGGHGIEGTGGFFEGQLGLRPGKRHATAAGASEAAAGLLLASGAALPVATALATGTMVTAVRKVHISNGPWATDQGWEYNAVIVAAFAAITEAGPGSPALSNRSWGPAVTALAVGAGVAGSYLVTEVVNEDAPPEAATDTVNGSATTAEPAPATA